MPLTLVAQWIAMSENELLMGLLRYERHVSSMIMDNGFPMGQTLGWDMKNIYGQYICA